MSFSSTALRRRVAAVTIALGVVALSACNNAGIGGSMAPAAKGARAQTSSCSSGYCWYTVDYSTASGVNNEVNGINDSREIVGNYSTGACTGKTSISPCIDCPYAIGSGASNDSTWSSYYSKYNTSTGYGDNLVAVTYPYAKSQFLSAISNDSGGTTIKIGCLVDAGGGGGGLDWTAGLVDDAGIWNFTSKTTESNGCSPLPVGAFSGIDDAGFVVGYSNIASDNCNLRAWQDNPGDSHKAFNVTISGSGSGSNIEATGVSSDGDYVVGSAMISGNLKGWYVAQSGGSTTGVSYESNPTAFTGITDYASETHIVGWYTKSSKTHGLVGTVSGSTYVWTSLDEPNASTLTVISGTNTHGDICGWYDDSSGKLHGFVGIATSTGAKRHPRQSSERQRA